ALGLVTSQQKARKLFTQLELEQGRARELEVEYGQLQLEASTWAMPTRVERHARERLRMQPPGVKRLQLADPRRGAGQ
ncbi:MAG: cell division protein FtsL, partial [Bacteroidota bacterium]